MNLKQRLDALRAGPPLKERLALDDLEAMTPDELRALQEAPVRRHLKARGFSDAEIDDYVSRVDQPRD